MSDQKALEIIGIGDALGVDTSTTVFWWDLVSKVREVKETQSDTGFWLGGVISQGRQYDHKGVVLVDSREGKWWIYNAECFLKLALVEMSKSSVEYTD